MSYPRPQRLYFGLPICCIMIFLLAACGSSTASSTATTPTTAASNQTGNVNATATTAETTLMQKMTFVGSPTAKIVSGTTFEVDGKVKNGDDKQHDIYVTVTLLDASGKQVGSATQNVDNVKGGATADFAIRGTAQQPTWKSVQATVEKVTENINGSGDD